MKCLNIPRISIELIFTLLFIFTIKVSFAQVQDKSTNEKFQNFFPSHYNISFRISSEGDEKWEAQGKVSMIGRLYPLNSNGKKNTTRIFPIYIDNHEGTLQIQNDSITVHATSGKSIPIKGISRLIYSDRLVIKLESESMSGEELVVSMEYTVKVMSYTWNTLKNGSSIRSHEYTTGSGENRTYFSTLPNTYAYQLFPCVYDPLLLSTFQLKIIRNENYSSISNTEIVGSLPDPEYPGWIEDKFDRTPPMTLDSLAFIVSDFDFAEKVGKDGTVIRVHAPAFILNKHDRGNFTASAAANVVDFYSGYFNDTVIPRGQSKVYPLKKINIVWTSGEPPMEKPGLIAYSGSYSDLTRWEIPSWTKERHNQLKSLEVIGPLLQQWFLPFTNALNCYRVWSFPKPKQSLKFLYIHLKELGMASISPEYLWNGTLALRMLCTQEYGLVTTYFHDNYELCYEQLVDDASRWIGNIFSTMRMLTDESVLGKELVRGAVLKFRRKLGRTLGERVVEEDVSKSIFLEGLQEEAKRDKRLPEHINVSDVLKSWDRQIGDYWGMKEAKRYLIVKVNVVNETHLSFTQERINGRLADEDSEGVKWLLPVTIQTAEGFTTSFWLENSSLPVILPVNHRTSKWLLVNPNGTSIHRTLYHPHLLQKLQAQLESNHTTFSISSRIRLMDDYFHFLHLKTYSGSPYMESENFTLFANVTVPAVLSLTRYLDHEEDLLVWINLIQSLDYLSYSPRINYARLYPPHPGIQDLNIYFRPKFHSILQSIPVEDMHRHPKPLLILEAQLLRTACEMGNSLCLEKARTLLKQWKANPDFFTFNERLPPIKELLGTVVMAGGHEGFEFGIRWFFAGDEKPKCQANSYRRHKVLTALTYSREPELLRKLFNMTMYNGTLACGSHQPSDTLEFVTGRMSQRLGGAELYRNLFYENCDRIAKLYPYLVTETNNILHLIPNIHTQAQLDEFKSFVQSEPTCLSNISNEKLSRDLEYYQENVIKFEAWMNKTGNEIFAWFAKNSPGVLPDVALASESAIKNNTLYDNVGHSDSLMYY